MSGTALQLRLAAALTCSVPGKAANHGVPFGARQTTRRDRLEILLRNPDLLTNRHVCRRAVVAGVEDRHRELER